MMKVAPLAGSAPAFHGAAVGFDDRLPRWPGRGRCRRVAVVVRDLSGAAEAVEIVREIFGRRCRGRRLRHGEDRGARRPGGWRGGFFPPARSWCWMALPTRLAMTVARLAAWPGAGCGTGVR